jgi:two-component system sensor histidine kinase BarA
MTVLEDRGGTLMVAQFQTQVVTDKECSEHMSSDNAQFANKPSENIKPRILMVEDNPLNLEVLGILLNLIGLSADKATSGAEALEILETNAYDMILMDLQMPEVDGFETCLRLRANSSSPSQNCKIVAVTAHAGPEWRKRSFECGMNDFIAKPVRKELLAEVIHRHSGYTPTK